MVDARKVAIRCKKANLHFRLAGLIRGSTSTRWQISVKSCRLTGLSSFFVLPRAGPGSRTLVDCENFSPK